VIARRTEQRAMSAVTTSRVTEDTSIADPLFHNLSRVYSPFPGDRRSQCTSDVPPLLCELRCQKASCLKLLCLRWYRLSPADLRRAPIEPCRRPSSVEIWVRYGRSIGIEAAIETPVSMIFSIPQRTLHSTFGRRQQFQEGSHNCFFDWSDPWMLVSRHNF